MKPDRIVYIDRRTGERRTENVPGEAFLRFLYHHPFGKLPLELLVRRRFLSAFYGKWMDREFSRRMIPGFVKAQGIDMEESERGIEEFRTFNDFFFRKLRPGARSIGAGLVSPADGKVIAFDGVGVLETFFAKGREFSIQRLVQDNAIGRKYADGTILIVRLAPADYHRFHFPAAGTASASHRIDGAYDSVSPYAVRKHIEIFCRNRRERAILDTEEFGDILICEIGAAMVGSIVQTYAPGARVRKGDEKGYFAFGGSSIILLLEKGRVKVHQDIVENARAGYESRVLMGESIGETA